MAPPPAQVLHVPEQGLVKRPVRLLLERHAAGPERDVKGRMPRALKRIKAALEQLRDRLHLAHLLVYVSKRQQAVDVVRVLRDEVRDGVRVMGGCQGVELEGGGEKIIRIVKLERRTMVT